MNAVKEKKGSTLWGGRNTRDVEVFTPVWGSDLRLGSE